MPAVSPSSFVRLYIVLGTAIGLSFLLTFSNSSSPLVSHGLNYKLPQDQHLRSQDVDLRQQVRGKADELRKLVVLGEGKQLRSLDPHLPEPIWLMFNDEHGYLNASTQNLLLRGLAHIEVQDVATNDQRRSASVSYLTENLVLTGNYQLSHKRKNDITDDQGKFSINVGKWYTQWSANVGHSPNMSYFPLSELIIESRTENVRHDCKSFIHGHKLPPKLNKILADVITTVLDKVRKEVDDKLYLATSSLAKVSAFGPKLVSGPEAMEKLNQFNLKRQKRQVPCERGEELDDYVDSLFRFASRLIRAMEPFTGTIPNVTAELPEYSLIIFLHQGGASHAYTIQRKKPAWVMCSNESISLGLTVGFEELRISYKFRIIQDWKLLFDGEMEAQIKRPKIQVQFTQTTPDEDSDEAVQQRIDGLRIWSIGPIRIMLKGLGNLTQAMSIFLTGFINRNIENFMPSLRDLETRGVEFANNLLQNISIPFFSII